MIARSIPLATALLAFSFQPAESFVGTSSSLRMIARRSLAQLASINPDDYSIPRCASVLPADDAALESFGAEPSPGAIWVAVYDDDSGMGPVASMALRADLQAAMRQATSPPQGGMIVSGSSLPPAAIGRIDLGIGLIDRVMSTIEKEKVSKV